LLVARMARRAPLALIVTSLVVAVTAAPAFAHTSKTVGAYKLTVGWQHEPTYTGVQNGVQLFVHDASGTPLDDLGPNGLKVNVVYNGKTSAPLTMNGSFDPDSGLGMHGEWDAAITPTEPGDYTFHFTGDINGQKIDESFTSGPQTFDTVKDPSPIEFPTQEQTPSQLSAALDRLGPRLDTATSKAKSASDSSGTATTLAVVALVVGVLLGGAGLLTGLRRKAAA